MEFDLATATQALERAPRALRALLAGLSPEHCLNAWSDRFASLPVEDADAADALVALAAQHGADLTLLCIGALTNVAEAIRRNPATMARLGGIVAMSGAFRTQHREANAAIDPASTPEQIAAIKADLLAAGFSGMTVADQIGAKYVPEEFIDGKELSELFAEQRAAYTPILSGGGR